MELRELMETQEKFPAPVSFNVISGASKDSIIVSKNNNNSQKDNNTIKTEHITINLEKTLLNRLRNAVYWLSKNDNNIGINYLISEALKPLLLGLEIKNGGAFSPREGPLKRGRKKLSS